MNRPRITYHHFLKSVVFLLVLFSCGSKKGVESEQKLPESNPKLLFLNYSVQKTSTNKKHITFINKIITDGRLKKNSPKFTENPSIGDLKCTQLDKNTLELKTVFIKNPLVNVIEVINHDSISFSRQKVEQNSAPLSLKLQLYPNTKYVSLSNIIDSSQNTVELIKTELE